MGRWSRLVATAFIDGLDREPGARWLDVGCGTGALTEAIVDRAGARSVYGVDTSPAFIDLAAERLDGRAELKVASGEELPFQDGQFDVVVSGLALNFMPDPHAALSEWRRVLSPDGLVSVYVWDYEGRMGFLRVFWDAVASLDSESRQSEQSERNQICSPSPLRNAFLKAGLKDVTVGHIEVVTRFVDFQDFWRPFLHSVGPAGSHVAGLDEEGTQRLAARLEESVATKPDGSIELPARAWTASGFR